MPQRRFDVPIEDSETAHYIDMYTFHDDIGVVNQTGEGPG